MLASKEKHPKSRDPLAAPGYVQFEAAGSLSITDFVGEAEVTRHVDGCFEIGGHLKLGKHFLYVEHRFFNVAKPAC
jgi:hypothetical protein